MSKDNVLGLPPISSESYFGFNTQEVNSDSRALSKGEIRETNQDAVRRRMAIDINANNNEHAIQRVSQMDQKAFVSFYKCAQFIVEMNEEARGTPYEKYCTPFCERLIQESAHHTLGLLNVSAARIAFEVNRPPEPEEPKGFWGLFLK